MDDDDAESPDVYGWTLTFSQTECACGGWRITGYPCPDCGRKPGRHEVDVRAQRRLRGVRFAFVRSRTAMARPRRWAGE